MSYNELNEKYAGAKIDYTPEYRIANDVNNQLGELYCLLRRYIPIKLNITERLHNTPYINNIYHYTNAVPNELAIKCRQFLNDIPFNMGRPLFNDIINPPNKNVYYDLCDRYLTTEAVINATYSPENWTWEKYNHAFFRASPLTKEAFVGSPIIELFDYLTHLFNLKLRVATWVIQRIPKGSSISKHLDDNGFRKMAFIYYLTPETLPYSYESNGGDLICHDAKTKQHLATFVPEFNSLVMWDISKELGPLHWVTTTYDFARICLVGFYV